MGAQNDEGVGSYCCSNGHQRSAERASRSMEENWRTQVFGLEPFEESQGGFESASSTPDARSLTPPHMETRDSPSPTKTARTRKSLFSRKHPKRSSTSESLTVSHPKSLRSVDQQSLADDYTDTLSRVQSRDSFTQVAPSIIPEPLKDLPSWFNKEGEWASATAHQFRARYPIHNPVGPRVYKNVHLKPESAGARPSSVFSPSFPPMAADHVDWVPPPSRTPSGTPLPTPESSQVRIPDGSGKTRSRKPSAVSPQDNVDLLDVSDPWGTNWHHTSPYDGMGLTGERSPVTAVSPDSPEVSASSALFARHELNELVQQTRHPPRSRMSSLNGGSRHKTTTPSPLSQSTSAVHLQTQTTPTSEGPPPVTRKMTKTRKPFSGVFGGQAKDESARQTTSAPTTPVDAIINMTSSVKPIARKPSLLSTPPIFVPKSASTSSIPMSTSISIANTEKKQKRGSVLVRFARRFSVMRRGTRGHSREPSVDAADDWHDAPSPEKAAEMNRRPLSAPVREASPEKPPVHSRQSTDTSKGVPAFAPAEQGPPELAPMSPSEPFSMPEVRRDSVGSLEAPFSIGRLTIANPDAPSSADNSPVVAGLTLPLDGAILGTTASRGRDEKTLPIPKFTLEDSGPAPVVESPAQLPSTGPLSPTSPTAPSPVSIPPQTGLSVSSPRLSPHVQPQSHTPSPTIIAKPSPTIPTLHASPSPYLHPSVANVLASSHSLDDSPLSKASMIVNPPTPYLAPVQIPGYAQVPSPVITPIPSSHSRQPDSSIPPPSTTSEKPPSSSPIKQQASSPVPRPSSRELSPTKGGSRHVKSSSSVRRETETFKLVRSPSAGNVQSPGETIVAQGEHWEVVGAESSKRTKPAKEETKRSKDSRRESRRMEREREEREKAEATEQAAFRASAADSARHTESRRSHAKEGSSRKRSSRDSREQHRRSVDEASSRPSSHVPTSTSQRRSVDDVGSTRPPSRIPNGAPHHERRPSLSNRPTSDIASAAELNAVRAREVWEMDRLFKGRSMAYGLEGAHVVYTQSIGDGSSTNGDTRRSSTLTNGQGPHGSQHTSYKLQSGFHGQGYGSNQIPFPQPGIYSNGAASHTAPAPSYLYPSGVRSYPDISTLPTISSPESSPPRRSKTNPLPEPPRLSPYKAPPMPPSLAHLDTPASADYWAKVAGVVTPTH
ncbi:hypothetical protein FA95DRAFT_1573024 [Auriscalpium vulgare]|uniref:Uncharacterized protein n=1 Tax=Auriscalpium vulgare TaxID=40419 RepID=A0ACB8RS74_9AGAM|nr:hypothetical protein FA95DRAFT_1573024 [Auriscalpium vulgare]